MRFCTFRALRGYRIHTMTHVIASIRKLLLPIVVTAATTVVVYALLYTHNVTTIETQSSKTKSPLLSGRRIFDATPVPRTPEPPSNAVKKLRPGFGKFPSSKSGSNPGPLGASRSGKTVNYKIPYMGNYDCDDSMCTEFLSPEYTYRCQTKHPNGLKPVSNVSCHFMDGSKRAPVALVSFPGSGNTWVRGLLEQATGICTGAVYCDGGLRKSGFIGEGYTSGAVIAVKTHHTRAWWSTSSTKLGNGPPWGSAILIIRNPRDALVAEWNRELSSRLKMTSLLRRQNGSTHVKYVGKNRFGDNNHWERFVKVRTKGWASYFIGWVLSATRRKQQVLVVKYENIKTRMMVEVERMLKFLGVPFSREDLKQRMSEGFETFHRTHPKEFEHFTSEQEQYVHKNVENIVALLKRKNSGNTLGVEEYL